MNIDTINFCKYSFDTLKKGSMNFLKEIVHFMLKVTVNLWHIKKSS